MISVHFCSFDGGMRFLISFTVGMHSYIVFFEYSCQILWYITFRCQKFPAKEVKLKTHPGFLIFFFKLANDIQIHSKNRPHLISKNLVSIAHSYEYAARIRKIHLQKQINKTIMT